jgi:hypothetical protein
MYYLDGNMLAYAWVVIGLKPWDLVFPSLFLLLLLLLASRVAFYKALATNALQERALCEDRKEAKEFR